MKTDRIIVSEEIRTKSGRPLEIGTGTGTQWKWLKLEQKERGKSSVSEELVSQLLTCFEVGFYHVDTAEVYTTHPEIGEAVKRSGIDRNDLFITSKFNGGIDEAPRTSKNPREALNKILKELDMDFVDLFLVHQPFFDSDESELSLESVWSQMIELKNEGKARYIGVSNFAVCHLERLFRNFRKSDYPVVNQIEFHPCLQNQSRGIVQFCQKNNILIEAYAPLAPLLGSSDDSQERQPLVSVLEKLSTRYEKTGAQILLRYCLQKSILPITTSSKRERIEQSLDVYNFSIRDDDMEMLDIEGSRYALQKFFKGAYENL
ncbi:Piso0_004727 [Millerozyma farinosa CBS 7064]|uniref:2-dehydropantolactone reductase n=1 Tax=Pichia sorbitophila (strain ATCC MYA-4447 / BCRC 22081 / CBS 7064 / NBRC 10061 / NRRL Y-12695) TaxID=559304 RepID=G8Y9L0_PICSO|nr:Piso0_004727 [Millerozyma farinosa CBS 7064]CCE85155.1 Piso0_004727 [Millerozyma farinosa CBS 7064]